MTRAALLLLACLAALAATGCGDPQLWERWQAERAAERARRLADRVLVRPSLARPAEWDRAEAAFRSVAERWPATRWAGTPGRYARDVAEVSARASIARARLEDLRRREPEALSAWREAAGAARALPRYAAEAAVGEALALQRAGRFDEALAVRRRLADEVPLRDPGAGWLGDVLQAPLVVARELRLRGDAAGADAVLRAGEARLARDGGSPLPAPLLEAVGEYAAARGDFPGAMAALRARLVGAGRETTRRTALALATRALELGRPDSAIACARWAESLGGATAARAVTVRAAAWEALGRRDSALAAWGEVTERLRDPENLTATARYRRGVLFGELGRFESARAEWRALQAQSPTHELAFLSMRRIVQHHLALGETELAHFEARRSIDNLERLLVMNADPLVQRQARLVRAELLADSGEPLAAVDGLLDVWDRFPADSVAEAAALRAARIARDLPGRGGLADSLFARIAVEAWNADVRRSAADGR